MCGPHVVPEDVVLNKWGSSSWPCCGCTQEQRPEPLPEPTTSTSAKWQPWKGLAFSQISWIAATVALNQPIPIYLQCNSFALLVFSVPLKNVKRNQFPFVPVTFSDATDAVGDALFQELIRFHSQCFRRIIICSRFALRFAANTAWDVSSLKRIIEMKRTLLRNDCFCIKFHNRITG